MYRLRKLMISIENLYGGLLFSYAPSRFRTSFQRGLQSLRVSDEKAFSEESPLSIVFVCRGNICRSPYAEKRLAEYWQEDERLGTIPMKTSSVGLDTRNGKPANERATTVALTRNVDLNSHQATAADGYSLSEADLIFVMERKHLRGIVKLYRYSFRKAVFLGSLAVPEYPLVIEDPYGRPEEEFQECFSQIDAALKNFIALARERLR